MMRMMVLLAAASVAVASAQEKKEFTLEGNPMFRDAFTADPAPLVVGDTLYVYVGHDEAVDGGDYYNITEWLCYSTKDMKTWVSHGSVLKPTDFKWAIGEAWASQVVEKDGKFYYYTTAQHGQYNDKAIGVAVSDSPTGPFKDPLGKALVVGPDTPGRGIDIDPTVWIDDDGTAWMYWGNGSCYYAKLKPNMIEIDGEIKQVQGLEGFIEGPWLHKRGDIYYLTYAGFKGGNENLRYATADKIDGPWTNRGELTGNAKNSFTIHPGIVEFKDQWYLFYHNATLTLNGLRGITGRRSVCAEYLYYNEDGTMQPVVQTTEGLTVPPKNNARTDAEKPAGSNTPYRVELSVDKLGIHISPTLNGIFYEDINQANDGGISAQLIQNNSFQMYDVQAASEIGPEGNRFSEFSKSPTEIYGWTVVQKGQAKGTATTVDEKPLVTFTQYYDFDENDAYDDTLKYRQFCIRFDIENPGDGFGLAANGFGINPSGSDRQGFYYSNNTQKPSIPVVAQVGYDLGLYLQGQGYTGRISVYLENAAGQRNSNVLTFGDLTGQWKKVEGRLTALRSEDSRLAIVADAVGTFYLDFVTLVPEASQLWRNGEVGDFRKDLLEALEGLNPSFMRFPGGCASEGPNYWGQVFWKTTIGPREERIGIRNHWGTWTSQHIGFYEYLLMAEALGAKALPVLNNGVTCQFAGRSYIAPLDTEEQRQRFHDIYVKDALDLIEFCNGDASTEWGAKRIAMGHPKPFNLEYLAIGNENSGDDFWERFDIICRAVKAEYPEIIMITTSGASASGREFNANYAVIDEKYPDSIVDEHYYSRDDWFYNNRHRYNADQVRGNQGQTYDRSKPTRVFVGEFANNSTGNAYVSTLAEAAYFTGLERNSDMVVMAAYAPLLCKKGFGKWGSNLIWFDNRGLWRTSNYYYMSLFSNHTGNRAIEMSPWYKTSDRSEDAKVYTSPTIDTETGTIYVKAVNAENVAKETTVVIGGSKSAYQASLVYIASADTSVKNQGDINHYSSAAGVEVFEYVEPITPQTQDLGKVSGSFVVSLPGNSVNVLQLVPVL